MPEQDITSHFKFDDKGLITAVVQDVENDQVLMVAYMDAEALRRTLESGRSCFYSRSRQTYWVKGETSGHVQQVREIRTDCDRDCLLIKVEQTGAACHEGFRSCFSRTVTLDAIEIVEEPLTEAY
jgi:phosphoribosyl-AMP cyclohydrolase